MNVDRRGGLLAFQQAPPLMRVLNQMTWSYEISERQQLATSDKSVCWVKGGGADDPPGYGFGLGNPYGFLFESFQ